MKTKWVILLFVILAFKSCNSQKKIDLENTNFLESYNSILGELKKQTEPIEIVTTKPIAYTYETKNFKLGSIDIPMSNEEDIARSSVGILINNIEERKTIGIKIELEDSEKSKSVLSYLEKKYGKPIILSPPPSKDSEGMILGYAAYYWELKKSIFLINQYEYTNGVSTIASIIYIIDSNAKLTDEDNSLVIDKIRKTYTP